MVFDEEAFISTMVGENRDLILRFFVFFSRFEYALKRCRHLRKNQDNRAEACWDSFANSIRDRFDMTDEAFREACNYLQQKPPRKQIVLGDQLDWRETTRDCSESVESYVLRLVRTVRNNLFHGGKYPSGPVEDDARNEKLLRVCLVVIEGCIELDDCVRAAFIETG